MKYASRTYLIGLKVMGLFIFSGAIQSQAPVVQVPFNKQGKQEIEQFYLQDAWGKKYFITFFHGKGRLADTYRAMTFDQQLVVKMYKKNMRFFLNEQLVPKSYITCPLGASCSLWINGQQVQDTLLTPTYEEEICFYIQGPQ